jgi:hypothetical protein
MQVPCHFCKHPIDTESPYIYRRMTGWVKKGRTPTLTTAPTGYACPACIDLVENGKQSETLFT